MCDVPLKKLEKMRKIPKKRSKIRKKIWTFENLISNFWRTSVSDRPWVSTNYHRFINYASRDILKKPLGYPNSITFSKMVDRNWDLQYFYLCVYLFTQLFPSLTAPEIYSKNPAMTNFSKTAAQSWVTIVDHENLYKFSTSTQLSFSYNSQEKWKELLVDPILISFVTITPLPVEHCSPKLSHFILSQISIGQKKWSANRCKTV